MKTHHYIFTLCLIIGFSMGVYAQSSSNQVTKKIKPKVGLILLDSFPILPYTLEIEGLDSSYYRIDYLNSSLELKTIPKNIDSISIKYRVVPVQLREEYRHKEISLISAKETKDPFSYVPASEKINYLNSDKINTLGSISRGIGFGNQQDVVVNSNLNLKINGRLNNKIDVLAAISDQNNPIQADGNTQQLQDFDRVFVQFKQNSGVLTLGDFDMFQPDQSYFLSYRKRSRGFQFNNTFKLGKENLNVQAEAAVSRGRFSRNTINGSEGNQGPYRLSGSQGEQFIIIIAGTEVVYLDGKKLVRGEQNDYVINYNSGELSFTPKQLITQYSRIVVEFQYSDRNYGRSVVHSRANYKVNKWNFNAHYFSEFDNKNQPLQQSLDLFDSINMKSARQILAETGDAGVGSIPKINKLDAYNPDRIMYEQKDSGGYTFFVYSTNSELDTTFYEVTYSYVGQGNGNYRQQTSTANGKVFKWFEPVNGVLQGDYEPVELLIPPNKLEMMTLQSEYQINKNSFLRFELARSNNDVNTFSNLDSDDDVGYGFNAAYQNEKLIGKDSASRKLLKTYANYEFKDKHFTPVERYRSVEFQRTWNRTINNNDGGELVPKSNENIFNLGAEISKNKFTKIAYNFSYYNPSVNTPGIRNLLQGSFGNQKTQINGIVEQLQISIPKDGAEVVNQFLKYQGTFSKKIKSIRLGGSYWNELSEMTDKESGEIEQNSYGFNEYSFFLQRIDSSKLHYQFNYRNRTDENASNGELQKTTLANDIRANAVYKIDRFNDIQLITAVRKLEYLDTSKSDLQPENTLQGRLEYNGRWFKRAIRTNMFYELGTGQEQRKEFSYIQVGDGNGNFIWNDYDSNGIQSLDEFEIASELDVGRANFIRQFLPVQGFVKSYTNRFSHFVRLQPAVWWRNSKNPVAKTLARFADVNTIRVDKKVTDNSYEVFLNPFSGVSADTLLVSENSLWRNTLYFDQSNPKFGAELGFLQQKGKLFLFNGFDSRIQDEYSVKVRFNFDKRWTSTMRASNGSKSFLSDYMESRNYEYEFLRLEPKLTYQYKSQWRMSLLYNQFEATNLQQYGGETTVNKEMGLEGKWTMVNRGVIQSRFAYVNIKYDGDPSKAVAYELLRGLKDGVNWKWSAQIDYRFKNDIQMLLSYEGRKSELTPIIHIGRLQARYLF